MKRLLTILALVIGGTAQAGEPADLPLPSTLPLLDYERALYPYIADRKYAEDGWVRDKAWRDTGPFLFSVNYGIHPAVRIYYSPEVIEWLEGGRKGVIADGAIVVKEMVSSPAVRYNEYRELLASQYPDDPDRVEQEFLEYLKNQGGLNWTVMVKDASVSHGGWFFASVEQNWKVDSFDYPFAPPNTGAGLGTCMRCHASAAEELIFSALDNVEGYPGEPLIFRVDESWRNLADMPPGPFNLPKWQRPAQGATEQELIDDYFHQPASLRAPAGGSHSAPLQSRSFLETFPPAGIDPATPVAFPSQWLDHVPSRPASAGGPQHFLTSDNCLGCHGGLGGPPSGTTMFLQTGPKYGDGYNISEYGEWRWSPMGLAGRDPVFFAQLESEFALLEKDGNGHLTSTLGTTCLSCHAAMGQRQLQIDAVTDRSLNANEFKPSYVMLHDPLTEAEKAAQEADGTYPYHQYGNLAREGISCAVCHHIAPPQGAPGQNKLDTYLMNGTTGVFRFTEADVLAGPYMDPKPKPMENAMGIRPEGSTYIKDSEMCGACHTINLPNVDANPNTPLPGYTADEQAVFNQAAANGAAYLNSEYGVDWPEPLTKFQHSVEQATYLEWVNSDYNTADGAGQSCQDCHMKNSFENLKGDVKVDAITTQIASIQDTNLPEVENLLPEEDVTIPFREDYARHGFVGLNAVLIEMFKQFDPTLGVQKDDYMTSATNGADLSIEMMALQARDETADVTLNVSRTIRGVDARVTVTNKTGHRFPSGVGFRRAFLEVRALDSNGKEIWCSGCANDVGVILGADDKPLKTEFLDVVPAGATTALYQPHHQVIDSENKVQIYEELTQNAEGVFTTSFIRRIHHPKDNRLTPKGWLSIEDPAFTAKFGNSQETAAFLKATRPEGKAEADPDFGPGQDSITYRIPVNAAKVTATLYYQSLPPYFLKQRFEGAPHGDATQRLYYIASRLKTKGTVVEGWKMKVTGAEAQVR
ncbi:MAG: hypothetical protein ACPGFA_01955 [Pikeienuella sp.]